MESDSEVTRAFNASTHPWLDLWITQIPFLLSVFSSENNPGGLFVGDMNLPPDIVAGFVGDLAQNGTRFVESVDTEASRLHIMSLQKSWLEVGRHVRTTLLILWFLS